MGKWKTWKIVKSISLFLIICSFTREKVIQMLSYIIEMPPEGCSHARGHTMPFVASEIFGCEMQSITSKFFNPEVREEKEFIEQ